MNRRIALAVLLASGVGLAQWNAAALGGFGVATLSDPGAAARLAARFRASGNPVFLIGNLSLGLQQGDMIRFPTKAVLIDADVWQTLRTEGALSALKVAPVVRVKARAQKAAWQSRAQAVSGQERKAYELGERLLASMEGAMPVLPDGQKLSIAFEAGQMVLSVPPGFLERFRLPTGTGNGVRETPAATAPKGLPKILSAAPASLFAQAPVRWELWALDASGGPTADIRISLDGALPPGLAWNETSRTLEGTPTTAGTWPLTVRAANPQGQDTLAVTLRVVQNRPPRFLNAPSAAQIAQAWHFAPVVNDSDHAASQVRILPRTLPPGARWDSTTSQVHWTPKDTSRATLGLVALDALGDSTAMQWSLAVTPPQSVRPVGAPRFVSELGSARVKAGQSVSYRPVAISPDGDSIAIEVILPKGSPLRWNGERLLLTQAPAGEHMAELVARDTRGNQTRQRIGWTVETTTYHLFLQTRYQSDLQPWAIGLENGMGRIGLFTPSGGRLFGWDRMVDQEWPYLFVGANFLPEALRLRGNSLVGDLGFTLRAPKTSLYTGGLYGRIAGHFITQVPMRWETNAEVQGWIRQAVMVADTNVIRTIDFSGKVAPTAVKDSRWTLDKVVTVQNRYWDAMDKVMRDQSARDNIVLMSHVDAWTPVGAGLQVGGGLWRIDMPTAKISEQTLGAGLKGGWSLGSLRTEPSALLGWGPQGAGLSAAAALLVTFGN